MLALQELGRFNVLLSTIRSSLVALGQAVKGLALMSDELDAVGRALFDGKVPALWLRRSFPSLKPLGSYIKEVLERVAFFSDWITKGAPPVFWISGFFFIQVSGPAFHLCNILDTAHVTSINRHVAYAYLAPHQQGLVGACMTYTEAEARAV